MSQDATSRLVLERPGPGRPQPYRFPAVLRQTAADGRGQVVAAHLPGQPLAVAKLLLDAGAGREPAGREGLASVLARALEEGTAVRDAAAYALALEGLGAELFTAVDWDSFRIGVEAPVQRLPAAVELLAEAARTPRLDPADVARVRDDEVTSLRMYWAEPGPRADAALRADLFGIGQRQGRPVHGDLALRRSPTPARTPARWTARSRRRTTLPAGSCWSTGPARCSPRSGSGTPRRPGRTRTTSRCCWPGPCSAVPSPPGSTT